MALTGVHKKGAVSNMIDKIYQKDRKMVNNMYKGNMFISCADISSGMCW